MRTYRCRPKSENYQFGPTNNRADIPTPYFLRAVANILKLQKTLDSPMRYSPPFLDRGDHEAEDAEDIAIYDARKAELATGGVVLPTEVSAAILRR
jgi:hypothetical protein